MVFEAGNWGEVLETRSEQHASKDKKDVDNSVAAQKNGLFTSENVGLLLLERQHYTYKFFETFTKYLQTLVLVKNFEESKHGHARKFPSDSDTKGNLNPITGTNLRPAWNCRPSYTMDPRFTCLIFDAHTALYSVRDHCTFLRNEPLYLYHAVNNFHLSHSINHPDAEFIKRSSDHDPIIITSAAVLNYLKDSYASQAYWNLIYMLLTSRVFPVFSPFRIWKTAGKELNRTRAKFRWFLMTDENYAGYYTTTNPKDLSSKKTPIMKLKKTISMRDLLKKSEFTCWMLSLADAALTPKDVSRLLKEINEYIERVPQTRENISEGLGEALANVSIISTFMERCEDLWGLPVLMTPTAMDTPDDQVSSDPGRVWKTLDWANWYFPKFDLKGQAKTTGSFAQIAYACINQLLENYEVGLNTLPTSIGLFHRIEFGVGQQLKSTYRTLERKPSPPKSGANLTTSASRAPTILVTASALKTLRKIFRAELDGTIAWPAFEYAMTDAGFTFKTDTSVARIVPNNSNNNWKQINIYRPYPTDRFAGETLLGLNLKLAKNYEWNESTFGLAKKQ
ncbi:uncharacterized protein H6S33_001651 [Morchella sextelata]|uniref:uncharacterized protein n=1 Tax=Morchella sextelata TaxID=1174677 RepID=UPI001D04A6FD|nr:uncharacterized protein H6S33_001651 [Morchella sextelata]KAH0608517.1 hypothetical protein H6S33_001651 [Morchella sextelata]